MWLPGVRNLHSARETWAIKAGVSDSIDRLVAAVESVDTEECLEVHKVLYKQSKVSGCGSGNDLFLQVCRNVWGHSLPVGDCGGGKKRAVTPRTEEF